MKTTIEIEIPDEIIRKTIQELTWETFQRPNFGSREGVGTALLRKQVEAHVSSMDVRGLVREATEKMAQQTVEELVREKLRKMSREEIGKLLKNPALI